MGQFLSAFLRSGSENDTSPSTAGPSTSVLNSGGSVETRVTVRRKESANGHLRMLNDLRKDGKYVDVTLKFDDGQKFSCHRIILASFSSYFDGLFSSGFKESKENEIQLQQFNSNN